MKETTDPSGAGECEDNNQQKIGRKNNRKRNRNNGRSRPSLSLSLDPVRLLESSSRVWRDGWMGLPSSDSYTTTVLIQCDEIVMGTEGFARWIRRTSRQVLLSGAKG